MKSKAEDVLAFQLEALGIEFQREVKFHPTRKWRADFTIGKLMIEIDGGLWLKKGGHNTATGIMRDMEKGNAAQELGYTLLRFTPQQVKKGVAVNQIEKYLNAQEAN
jgi:very-short-patch-repair endonuclease